MTKSRGSMASCAPRRPLVTRLPASQSICSVLTVHRFIDISLITSVLVIRVCCLRRPTRVEHVPPLLQEIRQLNTKVIHHCASVNGIEEHSRRPNGPIGGDADRRVRESGEQLQGLGKDVACKPFLRSVCIRIDISRVHGKVRCLLRETASFRQCAHQIEKTSSMSRTSSPLSSRHRCVESLSIYCHR